MQITNIDPLTNKVHTRRGSITDFIEDENGTEILDGDENKLINGQSQKKAFNNIFSVGDVCLTPANEEKTVFPLK